MLQAAEVRTLRVPVVSEQTVAWLQTLPAPVRVAYEAEPTGCGLARACGAAGIACTVAAPSRIPRASGDRVKTDRRDAERLARLLRLAELVPVCVPSEREEAARDLVRAREDARGDLMRARHRLSKLLLRHVLVFDGSAWTGAHDAWLRRQRFASRPARTRLRGELLRRQAEARKAAPPPGALSRSAPDLVTPARKRSERFYASQAAGRSGRLGRSRAGCNREKHRFMRTLELEGPDRTR
jgi:transposase